MICEHRNALGQKLDTWTLQGTEVCPRCVEKVRHAPRPVPAAQLLAQIDYAAIEAHAMTEMMRDIGMEFVDDEVMATEEQFAEFEKRWKSAHPEYIPVNFYSKN